jgi:hypothetical protein
MMTENTSHPGEVSAGGIKKGGRHCSVRPPNNQTNQPLSLRGIRVGKPKTRPVPVSELKYETPSGMEMFKIIFNLSCAALGR